MATIQSIFYRLAKEWSRFATVLAAAVILTGCTAGDDEPEWNGFDSDEDLVEIDVQLPDLKIEGEATRARDIQTGESTTAGSYEFGVMLIKPDSPTTGYGPYPLNMKWSCYVNSSGTVNSSQSSFIFPSGTTVSKLYMKRNDQAMLIVYWPYSSSATATSMKISNFNPLRGTPNVMCGRVVMTTNDTDETKSATVGLNSIWYRITANLIAATNTTYRLRDFRVAYNQDNFLDAFKVPKNYTYNMAYGTLTQSGTDTVELEWEAKTYYTSSTNYVDIPTSGDGLAYSLYAPPGFFKIYDGNFEVRFSLSKSGAFKTAKYVVPKRNNASTSAGQSYTFYFKCPA